MRQVVQDYDGPLRLIVEENRLGTDIEEVEGVHIKAFPIDFSKGCRVFELQWNDYVSFSVTDDKYPPVDNSLSGMKAGIFQENLSSDFSAYIQREKSQIFDIFDRELKNWTIITLNRCVEIVSYSPLEISLLS